MFKNKSIIFMLLILTSILISACGNSNEIENPNGWEVNNFTYTNQEGNEIGLEDLKGKVWVSNFIFTSCATVCPTLTANLAKLQNIAKEEKLDLTFVSFSVDPEKDTPEALKQYGSNFTQDFTNWHFLTGYSFDEIEKLAYESFKGIVVKTPNSDQVTHGTSFYLIDQNGVVVQDYNGSENVPYDQIIKDAKILLR